MTPLGENSPLDPRALNGRTILQIVSRLDDSVPARVTLTIAGALADAGARALVCAQDGDFVSELQARGGVYLPLPAASKNPIVVAFNIGRLTSLIAAERVDLVHARSRPSAWAAFFAARRANVGFVTTYYGGYGGQRIKRDYNAVMTRGESIIVNSLYAARQAARHDPGVAQRIVVAPRGVNLRLFSPQAVSADRVRRLRAAWGAAPHERVILLAARLAPFKGQKILLEAAAIIRQRGLEDVRFILAGEGEGSYARALDRAITAYSLGDCAARVGFCDDMPAALSAASLVVTPSLEAEAFVATPLEAQAMGAPVIVSDIGALSETVLAPPQVAENQRTGWRAPPGDARALADLIETSLDLNASARDALAQRAREHIAAHFSLERMCAVTLSVYARILSR